MVLLAAETSPSRSAETLAMCSERASRPACVFWEAAVPSSARSLASFIAAEAVALRRDLGGALFFALADQQSMPVLPLRSAVGTFGGSLSAPSTPLIAKAVSILSMY